MKLALESKIAKDIFAYGTRVESWPWLKWLLSVLLFLLLLGTYLGAFAASIFCSGILLKLADNLTPFLPHHLGVALVASLILACNLWLALKFYRWLRWCGKINIDIIILISGSISALLLVSWVMADGLNPFQ